MYLIPFHIQCNAFVFYKYFLNIFLTQIMLKRTLDNHECYEIQKITRELFGDPEEYIKTKLFDSKWTSYVLCKNNFPYMTKYTHKVLFINPLYENFYSHERVECILKDSKKYWINPTDTKSIHTIKHYQVYF